MIKNGGFIRKDDLARIPYPIEREPISSRFEKHKLITFPPPGAGRVLIEMLHILSQFKPSQYDPDTPSGDIREAQPPLVIRDSQLGVTKGSSTSDAPSPTRATRYAWASPSTETALCSSVPTK